jgi:hypothetical protein
VMYVEGHVLDRIDVGVALAEPGDAEDRFTSDRFVHPCTIPYRRTSKGRGETTGVFVKFC